MVRLMTPKNLDSISVHSGVQLPDTGNAKTVAPATAPAETNQTTATTTAPQKLLKLLKQ